VPSVLTIHAPGYQTPLLAYIIGDGDFPSIDTSTFLDWQCAFVEGGYLHRYAERLRELCTTGRDPSERPLSCPLCPMPLCGVGTDRPEAVVAARRHVLEHLRAHELAMKQTRRSLVVVEG